MPHDSQPWHEVLALARRAARYESREMLREVTAASLARPASDLTDYSKQQSRLLELGRAAYGEDLSGV